MTNSDDFPVNPFAGLRVAITRGTSGLGLALLPELLNRGAQVAFVARGRGAAERVVREHRAPHGIVGDVSKKNGIHPMAIVPLALLDTECEDLERALATNVLGPFRLTKALLGALASSAHEGRGTHECGDSVFIERKAEGKELRPRPDDISVQVTHVTKRHWTRKKWERTKLWTKKPLRGYSLHALKPGISTT